MQHYHCGMSRHDSNLLLELLQSDAVFNLEELGQSPRFPVGLPEHPWSLLVSFP